MITERDATVSRPTGFDRVWRVVSSPKAIPIAMVLVVVFGGFIRLYQLRTIPPGLFFDEAANLFDISDLLNGAHPFYFVRNNGREPFFFYWAYIFALRYGATSYTIRLADAVLSTIGLPVAFFCAREFLLALIPSGPSAKRWATWGAVVGAFVVAITYFGLHYSRMGLRTNTLPFFLALGFGCYVRGIRKGSWLWAVLGGIVGGLSTYTYISARIAPALLVVMAVWFLIARRWKPFRLTIASTVLWGIVSAPLAIYFLRHAKDVEGHTDDVSILNPANNGGHPIEALVNGVFKTLQSFLFQGSLSGGENLPGRPVYDPLLGIFFVIGLVAVIAAVLRPLLWEGRALSRSAADSSNGHRPIAGVNLLDRAVIRAAFAAFLILWILNQVAPSALAVNPPGFSRMTGAIPAGAIVIAVGVLAVVRWLSAVWRPGARQGLLVGAAIATVALLISGGLTVNDYFGRWAPSDVAYTFMMADKTDASNYLDRIAPTNRIFLAPLYAQDNTFAFMTRGQGIQSFDLGRTLVVPTDRSHDALYVFPANDPTSADNIAKELPSQPQTQVIKDPTGRHELLIVERLPAASLPAAPTNVLARLKGGIAVVGAEMTPSRLSANDRSLTVQINWLNTQPQSVDYTVFVHVRSADEKTLAQEDNQPGIGSFPTSQWHVGDLISDRHVLDVSSLPPGQYNVIVGLYDLKTLQRVPVESAASNQRPNEVVVGTIQK